MMYGSVRESSWELYWTDLFSLRARDQTPSDPLEARSRGGGSVGFGSSRSGRQHFERGARGEGGPGLF